MTDAGLKNLLGFLLRNKETAFAVIDNFKPEDIEKGILAVPEKLINEDVKMLILDLTSSYVNDFAVLFIQNAILLDLDLNVKPLGKLKAKYMLHFNRFDFYENTHKIRLAYKEDVRSEGNLLQNMAFKAAGLKNSYIQLVADMLKLNFVQVEDGSISIDLDALEFADKIPPELKVRYIGSEDGILKFEFYIA